MDVWEINVLEIGVPEFVDVIMQVKELMVHNGIHNIVCAKELASTKPLG